MSFLELLGCIAIAGTIGGALLVMIGLAMLAEDCRLYREMAEHEQARQSVAR